MRRHSKFTNKKSNCLRFSKLARRKNFKKENKNSFWLGEPYFKPPKKLNALISNAINEGYNRYSHPNGLQELRQFLAIKYESNLNNFIITAGAKPALSIILSAILDKKDEAIIFNPNYPSYKSQIKIAEITTKIHEINLDQDFKINFDVLENIINQKTKVIIVNSPHNPTGNILNKQELNKLLKLANKFNFYIIYDGVYNELKFKENLNKIIIKSRKIIYLSSFSKTLGITGWRIGYLHSKSKDIINMISFIQRQTNTNTNTFLQKAIADYFKKPNIFIKNFKNQLEKRTVYMEKSFKNINKIKYIKPNGGFFAFININKMKIKSDKFAFLLLKSKNVAVTPGIVFGKNWDNYIRICFAVSNKEFIAGIKKLKDFINEN